MTDLLGREDGDVSALFDLGLRLDPGSCCEGPGLLVLDMGPQTVAARRHWRQGRRSLRWGRARVSFYRATRVAVLELSHRSLNWLTPGDNFVRSKYCWLFTHCPWGYETCCAARTFSGSSGRWRISSRARTGFWKSTSLQAPNFRVDGVSMINLYHKPWLLISCGTTQKMVLSSVRLYSSLCCNAAGCGITNFVWILLWKDTKQPSCKVKL